MLDTTTGRWMQPDPKGFAAGDGNLQRDVSNDPANLTDPTGLFSFSGFSLPTKLLAGPGPAAGVVGLGVVKTGLMPAMVGLTQTALYTAAGWGEANTFGILKAPPPKTTWAQGGLLLGHGIALGQGVYEMYQGRAWFWSGAALTVTSEGAVAPVSLPVAAGGLVVYVHGTALTGYSSVLVGRDLAMMASSATPPPPGPGSAGSAGNPAPIGNPPPGAKIIQTDPNGKWVIFENAAGETKIQFDPTAASNMAKGPLGPARGTPDTGAFVGDDGKVVVVEGMHRLEAAQGGGQIPVGKGGVSGLPGWLEYDVWPKK